MAQILYGIIGCNLDTRWGLVVTGAVNLSRKSFIFLTKVKFDYLCADINMGILDRIADIEKEMARTQKNKGRCER